MHSMITADTWCSIARPSVAQFFFAGSKIRTVKWRVLVTSNWIFLIIVQIISDLGNTPDKAVVNIQNKQKTSIFIWIAIG